jgi:hypothetical protein
MLQFVSGDGEKEPEEEEQNHIAQRHATPVDRGTVISFQSPVRQGEAMETEMQHSEKPISLLSDTSVENYEFAVHGLLALGSGMGSFGRAEVNYSPRPTINNCQPTDANRTKITIAREVPIFETSNGERRIERQSTQDWQSMVFSTSDGSVELPHERALDLLKYYRYKIAPCVGYVYNNAEGEDANMLVKAGHL